MQKNRLINNALCIALLLTVGTAQQGAAQRYLGVATGNYNAMNSIFLNPANIAGGNERISIFLFSANVGVDNNLGTISSIGNISKTLGSSDSGTNNIFKFSNNKTFSMMVPSVEVRGPGVLYSINTRHTLAFTTRFRVMNEFNNFDKSLYTAVTDPITTAQGNINFNAKNFNWTAHVWSELGLSYGAVIVDKEKFQLKGGVTLRYLMGAGYLGLKGKNLDFSYKSGSDSIYTSNSDIEFASNVQSLSDAFTNGVSANKIFGGQASGKGFGGDLGFTFLYRPQEDHEVGNGYKFGVTASVTDVGSIVYKTSYNVNVTGNGYLSGNGIKDNVSNYDDFRKYVRTQGYTADTGTKSNTVYMPTAIVIGADYHVYKYFYANATFIENLANEQNFGTRYYNQITITPRFDPKLFSVGLPLTYNMLSKTMRVGLGVRFSGFFIGSDDMMALFSNNQYGFNAYFGGFIPFYAKNKNRNNFKMPGV